MVEGGCKATPTGPFFRGGPPRKIILWAWTPSTFGALGMQDMLIVSSEIDPASMNIRDRLLELGDFNESVEFMGNPVYEGHGGHLITLKGEALYLNNVDAGIFSRLGIRHKGVVYLSRHSAKSGTKSLTTHPIGNFSHARYGGYFRQIVHGFPGAMTQALRIMDSLAREEGIPHAVSFEVTHHGPYLNTPTFFVEIGSDEVAWEDVEPARIIARTVLDLEPDGEGPVLIGVGGGHYAPRHTELALRKEVTYSHIIPSHVVPGLGELLLDDILDYVCEARLVYFHRKAMRKEDIRRLTKYFEERGLEIVRERDLPDLPGATTD